MNKEILEIIHQCSHAIYMERYEQAQKYLELLEKAIKLTP